MNLQNKNRPKVVWWIDHLGHGGSQESLIEITQGLATRVSHQTVVVLNNVCDPIHILKLKQIGVNVRILGKWRLMLGIGLVETWWWLRKEKFDATVTFLFYSDVVGTLLSHVSGVRNVVSCQRSTNKHYSKWQRLVLLRVLNCSSTVVLNSQSLFNDINHYLPRDSNVEVINTGIRIDKDSFNKAGYDLRKNLLSPSNALFIGSIGRLAKEKGFDILIDVVPLLKTTVHVVIVGSGPSRNRLQMQIDRLGIADRVHMIGYSRDVEAILSQLNVYVQLSRFEGLPVALLEAVAANRPVVTTGVGGISDLIMDDRFGWTVQPRELNQIAFAIDEALQDQELALNKVQNAKAKLVAEFGYESMIESWNRVLTSTARG